MSETMTEAQMQSAMRREAEAEARNLRARVADTERTAAALLDEASALLESERARTVKLEAERDDAAAEVHEAWQATGVASTVRGLTTLADVVAVHRQDMKEALARATAAEERAKRLEGALRLIHPERVAPERGVDPPVCLECGEDYLLLDGADPSAECDSCAQAILGAVRDAARAALAESGSEVSHG